VAAEASTALLLPLLLLLLAVPEEGPKARLSREEAVPVLATRVARELPAAALPEVPKAAAAAPAATVLSTKPRALTGVIAAGGVSSALPQARPQRPPASQATTDSSTN
jgi:hypothetical protein